jgi:hypothetical protein
MEEPAPPNQPPIRTSYTRRPKTNKSPMHRKKLCGRCGNKAIIETNQMPNQLSPAAIPNPIEVVSDQSKPIVESPAETLEHPVDNVSDSSIETARIEMQNDHQNIFATLVDRVRKYFKIDTKKTN